MTRQLIGIIALSLSLTGCVGTWALQRDVDTSQSYPNLHSVPDRPEKRDFTAVEAELEDFEEGYSETLEISRDIRSSNPCPEKPK